MRYAASNPRASARGFAFWGRYSEHPIGIDGLVGNDLQHVPVFDDLSVRVEAEDVHARPDVIAGPVLAAMQDDEIALDHDHFKPTV
jgi:hypothetical protein